MSFVAMQRAIQSARGAAKPLLPTLLSSVLDIFTAHHQPACLDTLSTIIETFGEVKSDPELAATQQQALNSATAAATDVLHQRVNAGQQLSASGDLLRALLAAADAYLVFARDLLLTSTALPTLTEWAVAAVGLREKEPVNAAFSFMNHLLSVAAKLPDDQEGGPEAATAIQACIASHGERLLQALVFGVCDTTPRQSLRALSGVLYALLRSSAFSQAASAWMLKGCQQPDLPGAGHVIVVVPGGVGTCMRYLNIKHCNRLLQVAIEKETNA